MYIFAKSCKRNKLIRPEARTLCTIQKASPKPYLFWQTWIPTLDVLYGRNRQTLWGGCTDAFGGSPRLRTIKQRQTY